jgi:HSP20 family protein
MKLIKYDHNTIDPLTHLDRWFDEAFFGLDRSPLFSRWASNEGITQLAVNLHEDADNYYVIAELPGFDRKELKIELENAVLTLSGERKEKHGETEQSSSFSRSITVGDDVNASKVKAKLQNGVLTVTLPRQEARKPKTIAIS